MEGLMLAAGCAVVVIFLKLEVRRQRGRIERLEHAMRELKAGGSEWGADRREEQQIK